MDRIIEIAQDNRHLAVNRGFMTVSEDKTEIGRVPLDQIGAVIANAHGITYSNNLFVKLSEYNVPVVVCAKNHLPVSIVLPVEGNYLQGDIINGQAQVKKTTLNRWWRDIVHAKIKQQAAVLETFGLNTSPLDYMAAHLKPADSDNQEGQAARYYFQELFGKNFRRDRNADGINALLNYGYTILRASVIRAIIAAGLHPSLGIHHCNQYNAFRLADDLMEPFRPLIDFCVKRLASDGKTEIDAETKKRLVAVLSCNIPTKNGAVEISYLIMRLATSYAKCVRTKENITPDLPPPLTGMALWSL